MAANSSAVFMVLLYKFRVFPLELRNNFIFLPASVRILPGCPPSFHIFFSLTCFQLVPELFSAFRLFLGFMLFSPMTKMGETEPLKVKTFSLINLRELRMGGRGSDVVLLKCCGRRY